VQPTDHRVRSVFVFWEGEREGRKEDERGSREEHQGLVGNPMKLRLIRIAVSLGTVASMAIAGGASIKGW
jgi:hypothetical protein